MSRGTDFLLCDGFGCTRLAAEGSSHQQAQEWASRPAPPGRIALRVAGDSAKAKAAVMELVNNTPGFCQ